MNTEEEVTEKIVAIYKNLLYKWECLKAAGAHIGKSPLTIKQHYVNGKKKIPKKVLIPLYEFMKEWSLREVNRELTKRAENIKVIIDS